MNNKIILLFKIIKFNGDISPLLRLGHTYSQIAELIKNETEKGNVELDNGVLKLTQEGEKKLQQSIKDDKREGSGIWIEKAIDSIIPKIDPKTIYIPNQNELNF